MPITSTPSRIKDAAERLDCSINNLLRNNELVLMLLVPQSHHVKVEYSSTSLEVLNTSDLYGFDVVNIPFLQLNSVQIDNIDMHGQHIDTADRFHAGYYKDNAGSFKKVSTVESIFQAHPIYNNSELMATIQPFKDEPIRLRLEHKLPRQVDEVYQPMGSGLIITSDNIYVPQNQIEALVPKLSKLDEKRAHAIVKYITELRPDLDIMNIRLGTKSEICKALCAHPSELRFTTSTFGEAWSYASINGLLSIEDKGKFIKPKSRD